MPIALKRVYEPADATDGLRILVERLWPRGLSKARAQIDHWCKELAPSPELRTWFGHDPAKWQTFRARYQAELDENPDQVAALRSLIAQHDHVTFVFASREERFNNAVALEAYLGGAHEGSGA